jgi:Flp pilus assembly pilin Flp
MNRSIEYALVTIVIGIALLWAAHAMASAIASSFDNTANAIAAAGQQPDERN